jgi:hypothetical protein
MTSDSLSARVYDHCHTLARISTDMVPHLSPSDRKRLFKKLLTAALATFEHFLSDLGDGTHTEPSVN